MTRLALRAAVGGACLCAPRALCAQKHARLQINLYCLQVALEVFSPVFDSPSNLSRTPEGVCRTDSRARAPSRSAPAHASESFTPPQAVSNGQRPGWVGRPACPAGRSNGSGLRVRACLIRSLGLPVSRRDPAEHQRLQSATARADSGAVAGQGGSWRPPSQCRQGSDVSETGRWVVSCAGLYGISHCIHRPASALCSYLCSLRERRVTCFAAPPGRAVDPAQEL